MMPNMYRFTVRWLLLLSLLFSQGGADLLHAAQPNGGESHQNVGTVIVDRNVPYIHQVRDTQGLWSNPKAATYACGPTSMTMALAFFGRLKGPNYAQYVPKFFEKTNPEHEGAHSDLIKQQLQAYGLQSSEPLHVPSFDAIARLLDEGNLLILGVLINKPQGELDHILLVRGYTSNGFIIVNDPYGHKDSTQYWFGTDHNGARAFYEWPNASGYNPTPKPGNLRIDSSRWMLVVRDPSVPPPPTEQEGSAKTITTWVPWTYLIGYDDSRIIRVTVDGKQILPEGGCTWRKLALKAGNHQLRYWYRLGGSGVPQISVQTIYLNPPACAGDTTSPPADPGYDNAAYIRDVTLIDGAVVKPASKPLKVWQVRNTGTSSWSSGYQLVFRSGYALGAPQSVAVPATTPGATAELRVTLAIPGDLSAGRYRGYWQLRNAQGIYFGDELWVEVQVAGSQPPDGSGTGGQVQLTSPAIVAPGQRFQPEVSFLVTSGQLREDRGDMLRLYDNSPNYSGFPHIVVRGVVNAGQRHVFRFSNEHPMVAPDAEGTYTSVWRAWSNGGWVGPAIAIRFQVLRTSSNHPPDRPRATSPGDWFVVLEGQTVRLCAQATGDPDGDQVNEFYFETFESAQLWNSGWVSEPCVNAQGLSAFGYQWHVKVRDSRGAESDWSEARHFNIYTTAVTIPEFSFDPPAPSRAAVVTVRAQLEGCGGQSLTRRLLLNSATDGSANGTWRELAGWLDSPTLTAPWETFHDVEGNHLLRIEVKTCAGTTVVRDATYQLLRGVPGRPQLQHPASGFWSGSHTINFSWQPALRTTGQQLVVGTTPDPRQAPVLTIALGAEVHEYTATFPQDYDRLYWQVIASNEYGSTDSGRAWWIGIDTVAPTAAMSRERTPPVAYESQFPIAWQSSDNASGVFTHDLQVRTLPDGAWVNLLTDYSYAATIFSGQPGRSYEFRIRARDVAGNRGNYRPLADLAVLIDPTQRPATPWLLPEASHKRTIIITNRMASTELPLGAAVQLHFDTSTNPTAAEIVAGSQSAQPGADLRIVFNDQVELPRLITRFASDGVDLWLPTYAPIAAGTSSLAYRLYYGSPAAQDPGYQPDDVFVPQKGADARLLLYMDEGSGMIAYDQSGYGNHAQLQGNFAQPWPIGWLRSGLSFDGNSWLRIEDNASLQLTQQLTVEAWVRPALCDNRTRNVVAKLSPQNGPDTAAWRLFLRDCEVLFDIYSPHDQSGVVSPTRLQAGQWYHLAGSYDGATVRLFVNGVLVSERGYNLPFRSAPGAWVAVGSSGYQNENFLGDIDQVRVAASAITSFLHGTISAQPVAAAGEQQNQIVTGAADLQLRNVRVRPNALGGVLVQGTLTNTGAFSTYNEVLIDLLADDSPMIANNALRRLGSLVSAPLGPGQTVDIATALTVPGGSLVSRSGGGPTTISDPVSGTSFTLVVKAGTVSAIADGDAADNTGTAGQTCIAPPDTYEADSTRAQSRPATFGTMQPRNFDRPGDEDWLWLDALRSEHYLITTGQLAAEVDTVLVIYDSAGKQLARSDDTTGTRAAQLMWRAPSSGRYYLQVRNWDPGAGGCNYSYSLRVIRYPNIFVPSIHR